MNQQRLNTHWHFSGTPDTPASGVAVTLPHCWNAAEGGTGDYFRGRCQYRRTLTLSAGDCETYLFLEIGAAGLRSEVFVNGQSAGGSDCGYAMYRVALTGLVHAGDNDIRIEVDNREDKRVLPLMADFTFYGGIYRNVSLISCHALHFDMTDGSRDGLCIRQEAVGDGRFRLRVSGTVVSEIQGDSAVALRLTLSDAEGKCVLTEVQDLRLTSTRTGFDIRTVTPEVTPWQGTENPCLYSVTAEILCDGTVTDRRTVETGFRHIEITAAHGIRLNGKYVPLKGVARHQDFQGIGNALGRDEMELDMQLIQEMGTNSVRLAHYQHDDYFYTLCDRAGLLVWAEIPFISIPSQEDPENGNAHRQLEKLVAQVGNHPSVYCWGIQNEITIAVEDTRIHRLVEGLAEHARTLDTTRYLAQANVHTVKENSPLHAMTELAGYNLYYGWYYGDMEDLGTRLAAFHEAQPHLPVILSEYGVDTNPQYHALTPVANDYSEEYQLLFTENALNTLAQHVWILGGYHWNMFDFGSAMRNEGGVRGINQKGLVTWDRQLKKDAYHLFRAHWSDSPVLHLAGRRFRNRAAGTTDIMVATNLSSVTLFVEGQPAGSIHGPQRLKIFRGVPVAPGTQAVTVRGMTPGGCLMTDEILIEGTAANDPAYVYEKPQASKNVKNWFSEFAMNPDAEIVVTPGGYSIYDGIRDLLASPEARAVYMKYFGYLMENNRYQLMIEMMSIDSMSKIKQLGIPEGILPLVQAELGKISK